MKNSFMAILATLAFSLATLPAIAWDGYDWETGDNITIESGNLVRYGSEIEYYDWGEGEYRYGEVENIRRYGNMVELEIYDHDTGDYRIFEMYD